MFTTTTHHNTRRSMKRRMAAGFGVAAVGLVTLAAPVSAQESAEQVEDRAARVELACNRIPNLVTRTENVLDRINGDAETVGSLLWLDTRIAAADERGREDVVTVLENRRVVRASAIPVLETRLDRLDELSTTCADAGFGQ